MDPSFVIGKSHIHGNGVIAAKTLHANKSVGKGIVFVRHFLIPVPIVTQHLGKWINHSYTPNTVLRWRNGAWHIVTSKKIPSGTELTLNYSNTPWYIEGPYPEYV